MPSDDQDDSTPAGDGGERGSGDDDSDSQETKTIPVEVSIRQFKSLKGTKEDLGLTWRGFMLFGQKCMEENYSHDDY